MLSTIEFVPFIGLFFFIYILIDINAPKNMIMLFHGTLEKRQLLVSFNNFFVISTLVLSISFILIDNTTTLFFSGGVHPISINIAGTNFFSVNSLINGLQTYTFTKSINMLFYNGPFMFLSILDPIFLLQLPWFLVTLVSSNTIYFTPPLYYGAFIAAFVPIGFIYGLKRIISNVEPAKRKKLLRRIIITVLVLNLLVLSGTGAIQYYGTATTTTISSQDQSALLLSYLLKQGESVNSGPNEMPVIGYNDWNDTFYGFVPTEYYMFRDHSPYDVYGRPINLTGYGFYAAAGPFVMYKTNYSSAPVFNYYNYSNNEKFAQNTTFSYYTPPGSYTLSLSFSHVRYSKPMAIGSDSGQTFFLYLGKAIAIPFTVPHPETLEAVAVQSGFAGITYLSGMVTSSIGPTGFVSASISYYPFQYFQFNGISLSPNVTYYFWYIPETWQAANFGYVPLPISSGNGSSYIGTVGYNGITNVSKFDFSVPITLLLKSNNPESIPITASVNGLIFNSTIASRDRTTFPVSMTLGGQVSLSVYTNFTNYVSYFGSNITLSYFHKGTTPTFLLLDYPVLLLIPLLAGGLISISFFYRLDFKTSKKTIFRTSSGFTLITFIAFLTFFGLSWTLIPFLYNYTLFKILGIVVAFSFLVTVISYDWR